MTVLALFLALTATQVDTDSRPQCEPAACLARIATRAAVTLADPVPSELAGVWKNGGGLSGSTLYFFPDGSYVYTEWADILPETAYDKGRWSVTRGMVLLSPDSDVISEPDNDRRYLALRHPPAVGFVLMGIDGTAERFHELAAENPDSSGDEWLSVVVFTRDIRKMKRRKAELLRDTWRPD